MAQQIIHQLAHRLSRCQQRISTGVYAIIRDATHTDVEGFVRARTAQSNQIRGLLIEFGLIIPQGIRYIYQRVPDLIGAPATSWDDSEC